MTLFFVSLEVKGEKQGRGQGKSVILENFTYVLYDKGMIDFPFKKLIKEQMSDLLDTFSLLGLLRVLCPLQLHLVDPR